MKIFLDSANIKEMVDAYQSKSVQGFTTNPTLMRQAGVKNYTVFARLVLNEIGEDMPISFEVISNDLTVMERQARIIAGWGKNVYVKIPIITAVYMDWQIKAIRKHIECDVPTIISIFAGRVADIGIDPIPIMKRALDIIDWGPTDIELLWASAREVYNIKQAGQCGCDIITVPYTLLLKRHFFDKDINKMSLETVRGFAIDTEAAGYKL
jgi:transaldolase